MSDLADMIRHVFRRFGRPADDGGGLRADDATMDLFDHRLTTVELKQRQVAARLRLLEKAADPRGRFDDGP